MEGQPAPRRITTLFRARQLRRDLTFPERAIWKLLRDRNQGKAKFRRQHPVGSFIVDFVCLDYKLVIEIDGVSHLGCKEYDESRDAFLERAGYRVLRFKNDDVLSDSDAVVNRILAVIEDIQKHRA